MKNFNKQELLEKNHFEDDKGIKINKLLQIIEDSDYYQNILDYFKLDKDDDTFIEIPGARTMFTILLSIHRDYEKVDLLSDLKDIYFDYNDGFKIKFSNTSSNSYFEENDITELSASPIHSGERDFFTNLFEIDKYAKQLISRGHKDILNNNLEMLKSKEDFVKRYRLMHKKADNSFYLRAIISKGRYYNYDNNLTFVIALLKLHFEKIKSGVQYHLSLAEYNDSYLRLYFRTSELKSLKGIGYIQNTLLVSNDEIKREALRFSTVCSINFRTSKDNEERMFIKPKDIKTKILSITHGTGPERAFSNLEDFVKSKDIFQNLCDEIESIVKIKDHNQIVHLVRMKIENSTTDAIKNFRGELRKVLLKDVKTTTQLLQTFNKLMLLEGLEIDAKEYLRYVIYQALVEKK